MTINFWALGIGFFIGVVLVIVLANIEESWEDPTDDDSR